MVGLAKEGLRLAGIFHPHIVERLSAVAEQGRRFVHYSSAEAAVGIIGKQQVWMRNARVMNDFSELHHGHECLIHAYHDTEAGARLQAILDEKFPTLRPKLEQQFDGWLPHFQTDTFMTCISEHDDREDRLGRLSMWRAYGGAVGVAIVVRNTPFINSAGDLRIFSAPVSYMGRDEFASHFAEIVTEIENNRDYLATQNADMVAFHLFHMFRIAMLCTKHPGFHEEKEWRIIHSPSYRPSPNIGGSVEVIRGVPQHVYKLALQDSEEDSVLGADLNQLLDRIIIGPTEHPWTVRRAFVDLLHAANVSDPENRVFVSDIPIRQ